MRVLPLALALVACADSIGSPAKYADTDAGPARDRPTRTVGADAACAEQSTRAVRGIGKPVDIILVIDNSGSMTEEINAIRRNLNENFAAILAASGVDYRVILLSRYGRNGTEVCIDPPLAGAPCAAGLAATASGVFFHYDLEIDSVNTWCQILESFDRADDFGLAPDGWRAWLRPAAEKAFVAITDDSANCRTQHRPKPLDFSSPAADPFAEALRFHEALLARSPELFGVTPDVRYRWYSIVGMASHADATEPWFPHEGLVNALCDTGASPGISYQALSIVTDALRYPVCEGRGFDAVFRAIAHNVIESAKADCVFEVPEAPAGQGIDLVTVRVEYRAGDGSASRVFTQVTKPEACVDHAFRLVDGRIELCPETCDIVERDPAAEVNVLYGCTPIPQ